jgi:signal peptidase II
MKKPFWLMTVGVCFLIDILTKLWVAGHLEMHQEIEVIPGFFSILPITNRGIAFSLFSAVDSPWKTGLLSAAALLSLLYIGWVVWHENRLYPLLGAGLAMVSGGILGNSINRLWTGSVVDFLDFHYRHFSWPTFNLADTFISVGAGLILLYLLRSPREASCP